MFAFFCGVYFTMALLFIFINISLSKGFKERITALLMGALWLPMLVGLLIYSLFSRNNSKILDAGLDD